MAAPRADGLSLGRQRLPALRLGRRKRWQPRSLKLAAAAPRQAVTVGRQRRYRGCWPPEAPLSSSSEKLQPELIAALQTHGVVVHTRAPCRAVDVPRDRPSTCRTTEAVAVLQVCIRPGRLIELNLVDLPVRPHLLQNRNASVVGPPTGSSATVVLLSGYDKGR